ncbi:uncharacterized protein M6B38_200610 [Iris pallida]|uniref:WLM domain-containing protein n=1 Tax=Iris pallida TaxID=29817 RepID=A0AAX6E961_IRIPA|nr:uncharacterized protein M6B38_200610 [Iris pallida]
MEQQDVLNVLVVWRGRNFKVEVDPNSKVIDLGQKLQMLTDVKPDTLRLLVPQSANKSSRLITPFSAEHSSLRLNEIAVIEGKHIRMMGVFEDEIKEVSHANSKSDSRILGFDEEEKRSRQRLLTRPQSSLKLPQGPYIFCDFKTLDLPGIELNPPPSEALRRMHMLACDPGIVAIMNKHRWRVGIMTEMAPVGYVGISPKCILGFNKNKGEEISLRLRTDDLKGFRKYESIKKTLLHELAHMVYSEHDANFFALDSQLNQEAANLDWTKSRSHTLSGRKISDHREEELDSGASSSFTGQKLGGGSQLSSSARTSSVAAAYDRFLKMSNEEKPHPSDEDQLSDAATGTDPDDGDLKGVQENIHAEPVPEDVVMIENNATDVEIIKEHVSSSYGAPLHFEDNECHSDSGEGMVYVDEPAFDKSELGEWVKAFAEPDPDNSRSGTVDVTHKMDHEPDPDASEASGRKVLKEPDTDYHASKIESDTYSSRAPEIVKAEPDPDANLNASNTEVLQRIEEPVAAICTRIRRAIEMLRSEVSTPAEAISALQTLLKIIRNVIEHPEEVKFKRLRKANPQIQRNLVNYKAAMEVLTMVGFCEDVMRDEVGRAESYLVLKRDDPGLLWLAKSSLEVSMA